MSCAACSAHVEKAVLSVDSVNFCSVNLLTNSMVVEETASDSAIISAVQKAGYNASKKGTKLQTDESNSLTDRETPILLKRLLSFLAFLLILMYLSMGYVM